MVPIFWATLHFILFLLFIQTTMQTDRRQYTMFNNKQKCRLPEMPAGDDEADTDDNNQNSSDNQDDYQRRNVCVL